VRIVWWPKYHPWFRRILLLANTALPPIFLASGWIGNWPVFAVAFSLAVIVHALLLVAIFHPRCPWLAPVVCGFRTTRKEVWLTIDDGPDGERSGELAQVLQARGVRATFMLIGNRMQAQPEAVQALIAGGHTLANHTQTHPQTLMWCAGAGRLTREIQQAAAQVEAAGGKGHWFRAPVGHKSPWLAKVLRVIGARLIGWTVGGRDGWGADSSALVRRVLAAACPGAIVMLHEGRKFSGQAVLAVVDALQAEGYAFVIPEESDFVS
jgi:peptidoglycan-N-acetylglucosamine deacetylase